MGRRIDDIEVEVLVDGQWHGGWLDPDDWRRAEDGSWSALVRWTRRDRGYPENYMWTFLAEQIRRVPHTDT